MPSLVMGPTVPAQFPDLIAHRLTPVLYRPDMVQVFAATISPNAAPYSVHVKIETGMGRLGVHPSRGARPRQPCRPFAPRYGSKAS
jgi:alanine racemase